MSELIAEARVLIRPDLTGFRAALEAEVLAASKGVTVPVSIAPVASGGTATAAALQQELAASTAAADAAIVALTEALTANTAALTGNAVANTADKDAIDGATAARKRGEAALAAQSASLAGVGKGAGSAAAGLLGVRGATLAATGPFLAGAAAAITLTKAVQSAAQLESELNVFRVTAGATADEMQRVGQEAQALGRDVTLPAVGAQDAAEAMTELSKAGLSVQDSMDGARGVLQLATAAAISNADAVQIAASALNAFGLAGDQAVHVADVLTNAANLAQGSISDIGLSFQQAAAVAKQVGLSFEDTVALLTELQRAGLRGSDAGTSLRVSLIKLIAPSKKAAEVLDELNVHIRDAQGNIRPDVFNQFAAAQANLTRKQQDANAAIVFGTDGLRAYSIIARQGLPALQATREELDKQGSAAELAGARMTGLAGAAENLKNQLAALGLVIGKGLTPALTDFAGSLGSAIGGFTSFAQAAGKALGPLLSFRNRLVELTKIPGTDFALLANPFTNAAKALELVGGLAEDTGARLKFARFAVRGLVTDLNKVGGATKVNETVRALQNLADQFKGGDEDSQRFAQSIEGLIKSIQDAAAAADGNPINLKVVIPPEVLSGQVGAEAANATARGFADALRSKDVGFGAFLQGLKGPAEQAGSDAGKLFGAGFQAAVTVSVSEAAQSALDLAVARAQGNQTAELQILLEQRRRQQVFLDRVLARPTATTQKQADKNVALAKKAAQQLEQTRSDIKSIFDQRNARAAKIASDIRSARQKADQAIIDSITGADTKFEQAVEIARAQGGPSAVVKALEALLAQRQRDIDKAKATIKDEKTLQTTLRQLRAARFQTAQDLVAAQQAVQDAVEESFQKRLTFAELQAQLTGNDTIVVKAINAYIKYLRTVALPAAIKARKGVEDVKIAIKRLQVERKNLAKEAGESPDVFAARLFQQAADQFRRFGSNISTSATGLLSPQAARGQFAANLLGPTGQADAVAVRQRDAQLSESKKQTALLQVIARGPRREIKGVTVPKATQEVVAQIAANVSRGL